MPIHKHPMFWARDRAAPCPLVPSSQHTLISLWKPKSMRLERASRPAGQQPPSSALPELSTSESWGAGRVINVTDPDTQVRSRGCHIHLTRDGQQACHFVDTRKKDLTLTSQQTREQGSVLNQVATWCACIQTGA